MNNLHTIQNWMQITLVSRGDLNQKLALAQEKTGLSLDELIYSKKGVSAYERLDIYASGYVLRLLECMRADFPKLQFFLGEELFETFAKAYIVTIPSTSWNLYHLGEKFADFLKETQPKNDNVLFSLPSQVAHIERMLTEAMQDKGIEHENKEEEASLSSFSKNISIKQVPCLRLIQQDYDLKSFFLNIEPLHQCEIPIKKQTYLALSRQNYRVYIYKIEAWQYSFLSVCKNTIKIDDAIKKTAELSQISNKNIREKFLLWLPLSIELGFIHKV